MLAPCLQLAHELLDACQQHTQTFCVYTLPTCLPNRCAELVFVLHAINGEAEIFPAERHGDVEASVTPTKVPLMNMAAMTKDDDITLLEVARVAAFYDEHKKRYVLMWSTYATGDVQRPPPLFVASSLTQNPLGAWVIWALDLRPDVAQGVTACAEQLPNAFHLANLQVCGRAGAVATRCTPPCLLAEGELLPWQLLAVMFGNKDGRGCQIKPWLQGLQGVLVLGSDA